MKGGTAVDEAMRKASVLIEALPYIRTFFGKTFVIKYGGSAMIDAELKKNVALDLILLKYVGLNPVAVHGGGPEITAAMRKWGKEPRFVNGLRVTDAETIEIAQMVLAGKVNKDIVSVINKHGGKAVGISGKDGGLIMARKLVLDEGTAAGSSDLGFVGTVEAINPDLVTSLSKQGYIPVIATIAAGADGETYNINADSVAGELAVALGADKLIMLTDVEGIYNGEQGSGSLLSSLRIKDAEEMMEAGTIAGGMIPKVKACITALRGGVERTHIIDGRKLHSLLLEIFTDRGIGTMVVS